jgi:hypothetical protein
MTEHPNALLALKHAWNGAVAASDRVRELQSAVQAVPDTADVAELDLETFHSAALAQSNAVMALRGLIEELRRRAGVSAE